MANVTLDSGRRVFANLKAILFTPWTDESTLGTTTYDLVNIVGDSTSVEQEDNEINTIEHEFSSEPLYENVNMGQKTFTTQCIDFQNDVLGELFGWETDNAGDAFASISYKDLYCKIEMQFNSTNDVIVLPKVKLNSTAAVSTMKTSASMGNISGTCYSAYVTCGSTTKETDFAVVASANASTYTVSSTNA